MDKYVRKFVNLKIFGNTYRSLEGGNGKGSEVQVYRRDRDGVYQLTPGRIIHFFSHKIIVRDSCQDWVATCFFAYVRFFKPSVHGFHQHLGFSYWSKEFEDISKRCIVPVQCLYSPVAVVDFLPNERVNKVIPFDRKVYFCLTCNYSFFFVWQSQRLYANISS